MSTAEAVEAKSWAEQLVHWRSRGPGDLANAMRRVSREAGVDYGELWKLRYRTPARVWADVHQGLKAAYEAECRRQFERLAASTALTAAECGPDHPAVRAGLDVLGQAPGANEAPLAPDGER